MNSISPSSEERVIGGHRLVWHRWHSEEVEYRGALFFLHGQGDFSERYQEVAQFFLNRGIAFSTCDWPGHGRSSGKKGHVPSWQLIREITTQGLAEARALVPGKPVGLAGHSVGGLLALYLLGELDDRPDFAWISSPCLKPDARLPTWRVSLLRILSHLLPSLTISTGVSAEMCRESFEEELINREHLFHSRISLAWARTLLELAERVRTQPEHIPSPLPLIVTQGEDDQICPPQYCQEFVNLLQRDDLEFKLYPDTRHESFSDKCRETFFADVGDWFDQTLPNGGPNRSETSRGI